MFKRNFCIAGKNKIAIGAIDYLIEIGVEKGKIFVCINETDDGINGWQPSLLNYCLLNDIKIVQLSELYDIEDLFVFSLEFDKIIKTTKFKTSNIFNIHFSSLPKYKGMYTSIFPILNGDKEAGVTLHKIDEGIDTGEIIDQLNFEILNLTAFQLYQKFLEYGLVLFKNNFITIVMGDYTQNKQLAFGSTYNSKKSIDFKNIKLDINKTAFEIEKQIRAFRFRPFQLLFFDNLIVSHSKILDFRSFDRPGTILKHNNNSVVISTVDYAIELFFDRIDEMLESCESNDIKKLTRFIDEGYDVNDFGKNGWSPIIVSAYFNSIESFYLLVNNGADIESINFNGTSVVMYAMTNASKTNELDILKFLLESGVNPNQKDYKGYSLMHYALKLENNLIIDLINKYINVNTIS